MSTEYWEPAAEREARVVADMPAELLREHVRHMATALRIEHVFAAVSALRRGDGLLHERDEWLHLRWRLVSVSQRRRSGLDAIEMGWRAADALRT